MLFSEFLITAHLLTAINQALLSGVGLELCRVSGPIKFNPTEMVGFNFIWTSPDLNWRKSRSTRR